MFLYLLACTAPDDDDDDDRGSSAYEMPDRSGCDYDIAFDREADGTTNYTTHTEFDQTNEVAVRDAVDIDADTTTHEEYVRDADGCLTGYEYVENGPDGVATTSLTRTCDEHGAPTLDAYVASVEDETHEWEMVYVNTYDGDELVRVEGTAAYDGEIYRTWEQRYNWTDGRITHGEYDLDGEPYWTADQTWHDDEQLATWHQEEVGGGFVEDEAWGVDDHGRVVTNEYSYDGEDEDGDPLEIVWDDEQEWYDGIYQVSSVVRDLEGDGSADARWEFDCTDTWPWSCTVTLDGSDDAEGVEDDPYDGEDDHAYTLAWSCP